MRFRSTARRGLLLLLPGVAACSHDQPTAPTMAYAVAPTAVYTIEALDMPVRGGQGEARGINDAGAIAGWITGQDDYRAIRWLTHDAAQDLGNLPGLPADIANDINIDGTVVGFAFGSSVSFARAFVWTQHGGMRALPDLGGNAGIAWAINSGGQVAGWAADSFGTVHAARWDSAGNITDLNPPGGTSMALDINDAGDIAGWTFPLGGTAEHAHLWRHDGTQLDLGTPGGALSNGFGINNSRMIVGFALPPFPDPEVAFVWDQVRGMHNFGYGIHSQAFAISDLGRSVGLAANTGVPDRRRQRGTADHGGKA